MGRQDTSNARAPTWWENFHFRLHKPLLCDYSYECVFCKHLEFEDTSRPFIYGAIFEYARCHGQPSARPPRFVVAFRGTKLRAIPDLKDDVRIVFNLQGACSRFRKAREHVAELLGSIGDDGAVWLAGHSLGASVALDMGPNLMLGKRERRNLGHSSSTRRTCRWRLSSPACCGCRCRRRRSRIGSPSSAWPRGQPRARSRGHRRRGWRTCSGGWGHGCRSSTCTRTTRSARDTSTNSSGRRR